MATDSATIDRPSPSPGSHELPPLWGQPLVLRARSLVDALGLRLLTRAGAYAAVGLLMLIAAWFRTRALGVHFWVDEGLSVGIAGHRLTAIPGLLRQDGSPPLYYLLLHIWMSVFGSTERATHVFALLPTLASVPVAYWAGVSLLDRRAGLFCTVLAAGLPFLTSYGQETRMYSLVALLSLVVAASFVHTFVFRRRAYLPVFVLSLTAALYTHNWALFLAAACGAAFLVCLRETPVGERRPLWRDGLTALLATAVLYAPWVPTLLYTSKHTGAPWAIPPVFWSITQSLYGVVGGRGAAMALLLGGGAGLLTLLALRHRRAPQAMVVKVLGVIGVGTLVIAFAYSKTTPAWALRYLAAVVGPLLILFGIGLSRGRRLGLAGLALVSAFWFMDPVPTQSYWKSNVADAVSAVRSHLGTNPLVVTLQPENGPDVFYYLRRPARYATPLGISPDPGILDWREALARLRQASVARTLVPLLNTVSPGQRVLLVTPLNLPHTPLWMKLIQRDSTRWSSFMAHDRSFKMISTKAPHQFGAVIDSVRASVYERIR